MAPDHGQKSKQSAQARPSGKEHNEGKHIPAKKKSTQSAQARPSGKEHNGGKHIPAMKKKQTGAEAERREKTEREKREKEKQKREEMDREKQRERDRKREKEREERERIEKEKRKEKDREEREGETRERVKREEMDRKKKEKREKEKKERDKRERAKQKKEERERVKRIEMYRKIARERREIEKEMRNEIEREDRERKREEREREREEREREREERRERAREGEERREKLKNRAMAEQQYSTAKISVWWDLGNCNVPIDVDLHAIARNISTALSNMDYRGPVSIQAYGDTNKIPSHVQNALSSTGIGLNHIPPGVKDGSDKKLLVDMMAWAMANNSPANYLLISGDCSFSYALHQLRMMRYNVLLAQPPQASAPLLAAARSVWLWTSLLAGETPLQDTDLAQFGDGSNTKPIRSYICDPIQTKHCVSSDAKSRQNQSGIPKLHDHASVKRSRKKQSEGNHSQPNIPASTSNEIRQPRLRPKKVTVSKVLMNTIRNRSKAKKNKPNAC